MNLVRPQSARRRGAFAIVEALIASLLLLVVVLAVSQALLAGQVQVYDAAHRARAVELADALMDEILRLPYQDPDGGAESARADFDDLSDFDGFTESQPLVDATGAAYDGSYNVFTRAVSVSAQTWNVAEFGGAIDGLKITITITDGTGLSWVLEQFVPRP